MKTFTTILLPLLAAGSVSAHGILSLVTINGTQYKGPKVFGDGERSAIRKVTSPDPNYGANNKALTCGPGAVAASEIADANPGDQLGFDWRGADGSHWPHNTGPMLTYMASCGTTPCDQFDASKARWFKIHQIGRKAGEVAWQQQDIYDGGMDTVTLPKNIAPGNYLIRHEIIALHLATTRGMAEFYPGCIQVRVGGSGTGKPTDSELVSLPGAYSDDDPGIFDTEVYNTQAEYIFPGPPVAAFVSEDAPTSAPTSASSGASSTGITKSSSTPAATSTRSTSIPNPTSKVSKPAAKANVCKLYHAQKPLSARRTPRSLSRIMRRWVESWSR